ncbi:MAG: class I SAM-dependent methyltransferase [Chloroflexota bacterium]
MQAPLRFRLALKRLVHGDGGRGRDGDRVVERLALRPGTRVADIGSGFGGFAMRFAAAVGPEGRVFAVDVDPDLRDAIARLADERAMPRLVPVAAASDDPALPGPVDLVFLSTSFHHLPDRVAWFVRLRPSLAPDATVVVLETTPGLLTGRFGHATRPEDVRATLEAAGYRLLWRDDVVRFASLQAFAAVAGHAGGEPTS